LIYEQLEILRRLMERMKRTAEQDYTESQDEIFSNYIDYANHALAEIEAARREFIRGTMGVTDEL